MPSLLTKITGGGPISSDNNIFLKKMNNQEIIRSERLVFMI